MSIKYLFVLLSAVVITAGCNTLYPQKAPNVTTPPPYWQTQDQLAHCTTTQRQLAEMRVFHDREIAEMTEGIHIVRNREMERLSATGKELEAEANRQQSTSQRSNLATSQQSSPATNTATRSRWNLPDWLTNFGNRGKDSTPSASNNSRTAVR